MPEYRYRCDKCSAGYEIEKLMCQVQRLEPCPKCKAIMRRIYGVPTLNLNGWVPDPREMNAEKEAIAAGMYE